jgi:ligand-binding sensor domain-containing protein
MAIYNGLFWSTYDTRDGLPHNSVRTVYEDKEGTVWGGTDNGIFRLLHQHNKPNVNLTVTVDEATHLIRSGNSLPEPYRLNGKSASHA